MGDKTRNPLSNSFDSIMLLNNSHVFDTGTYSYHELKPPQILNAPVRSGICFVAMLSSFTEPLIGTLVRRKKREPFFLAEIFEKVSFDPYNIWISRFSARKSEQMKNF